MKKFFSLLMLILSLNAFAGLSDPEELEFTGALNDGDLKTVKMYIEQKAVPLEDKYFAWTPFLITAAKNQFEILKYLTEKGADINYIHPVTRMTGFHHAAFNGIRRWQNTLLTKELISTRSLKVMFLLLELSKMMVKRIWLNFLLHWALVKKVVKESASNS